MTRSRSYFLLKLSSQVLEYFGGGIELQTHDSVFQSLGQVTERLIGRGSSMICLDGLGVDLDGNRGIDDGFSKLIDLDACHGAIRKQDGVSRL